MFTIHHQNKIRYRIFIDRLWPRGLKKSDAKVDLWLKEIAPSNELRKWYNHDHEKWEAFKENYYKKLKGKEELLKKIKELEKENHTITLLYSSKEERINNSNAVLEIVNKFCDI